MLLLFYNKPSTATAAWARDVSRLEPQMRFCYYVTTPWPPLSSMTASTSQPEPPPPSPPPVTTPTTFNDRNAAQGG